MIVQELKIAGTRGYQIDDFYSNPGMIMDLINKRGPDQNMTKLEENNGNEFFDLRHHRPAPELEKHANILNSLIDDPTYEPYKKDGDIYFDTNFMKWRDSDYNNYEENFWYPHKDDGWVCIVYLNGSTSGNNGTNIYHDKNDFLYTYGGKNTNEETQPWKSREHFELIDYLEPAFNRAFLFQAHNLVHGAAIDDKEFFYTDDTIEDSVYRLNQAMFFFKKPGL